MSPEIEIKELFLSASEDERKKLIDLARALLESQVTDYKPFCDAPYSA